MCSFGSNSSGEAQLQLEVPDSITTWITEAVALSEDKGLGIARQTELKTFKPFFIDFTLPYHVIRGEQTKIPLTVYNYLAVCAEVTAQSSLLLSPGLLGELRPTAEKVPGSQRGQLSRDALSR